MIDWYWFIIGIATGFGVCALTVGLAEGIYWSKDD